MSNLELNKLDDLLRDWSAEARPDADHLSALQRQILDEWDVEKQVVKPAPVVSGAGRSPRSFLAVGIAIGTLATVFVGMIWYATVYDHQPDVIGKARELPPPEFAWLSDDQLSDKKILRDEMLTMFDQRFGWIAETGENLEIGLDGRVGTDDTPTVAVRVIVEQRNVMHDEWKTVWAVDVVALSEERVDITPQSWDFTGFRLWTYALPDGMVSLDTELDMKGHPLVATEKLQRDGKPEVIYQTRSGLEEIRVLQAAAVL